MYVGCVGGGGWGEWSSLCHLPGLVWGWRLHMVAVCVSLPCHNSKARAGNMIT